MNYDSLINILCMWIFSLKSLLKEKYEKLEVTIIPFGIFGLINYPVFYFFWKSNSVHSYDDVTLRIISTCLCLLLVCKNFWPKILKKFLPLFWYGTVTFCLPFYAIYVLLQNPTSLDWTLNTFLGLFLLIILLDWVSFSIVTFCGLILALLVHFFQGHEFIFPSSIKENIVNIFWVIATSLIFLRRKENFAQEKLHAMKTLAGTIAHEIRTPLLTIDAMAHKLKKLLPSVINGFKESSLFSESDNTVDLLNALPANIKKTTRGAFNIINLILMNLREEKSHEAIKICSINSCIDEVLEEYHLSDEEKKLIVWTKEQDFNFKGSPILIKHIFFNLLKNALHYIKAAHKGEIYINISSINHYNLLHFKDTGKGMDTHTLQHIFDSFYTKTSHGTGIGLAFCKRVMEELGGSITCKSEENKYAEFILKFPKVLKIDS